MNPDFPWVNPWRPELQELFPASAQRRPALRRSLDPDWLFAADLPACADSGECGLFLRRAGEAGWEALPGGAWIQLRRPEGTVPEGWFPACPQGEAACLRSLLLRHPGSAPSLRETNALLKAREQGPAAWERECRILHEDFASRLRLHLPLPRIIIEKE